MLFVIRNKIRSGKVLAVSESEKKKEKMLEFGVLIFDVIQCGSLSLTSIPTKSGFCLSSDWFL